MIKINSMLMCSVNPRKGYCPFILDTAMLEVSAGPFVTDHENFFKFYFYLMCMGILILYVCTVYVCTVAKAQRGHRTL